MICVGQKGADEPFADAVPTMHGEHRRVIDLGTQRISTLEYDATDDVLAGGRHPHLARVEPCSKVVMRVRGEVVGQRSKNGDAAFDVGTCGASNLNHGRQPAPGSRVA